MSDIHKRFLAFHQKISIPKNKITELKRSKQALKQRIIDFFKDKKEVTTPSFRRQGSYQMNTMVLDKVGTYDVDLGVYFSEKPSIKPEALQKWVKEAVKKHTSELPQHRDKCVRVIYKRKFHIDLPIYYQTQNDRHPFLATKSGWEKSNPEDLCTWFDGKKKADGQLLRVVKYFKVWAKLRKKKMPSGIALTVLVVKHYKGHKWDHLSFYHTIDAIYKTLIIAPVLPVEVINPTVPHDNLVGELDLNQQDNFLNALKTLIETSNRACVNRNETKAINLWRQQLGADF
jgi:hypothetical protein